MQWPSYQHMAARVLNQPLLLEPAYARVFFSALGERFGANRLVDGVTGHAYSSDEMKQMAIGWSEDGSGRRVKSYRVENGIAILPVTGTLVHKFGYMQPISGITGYDGIIARLNAAMNDPDVKGVLLDIDSPGGEVAGAFDTSDLIARMRDQKPIWSLANDTACSAGYLLASACSERLITQTGVVGSIGVVVAHRSVEKALEEAGVDITLIYSGSHKVDGNPYQVLPKEVRAEIQARVDDNRDMFATKVSAYSGLSKKVVLATEAAIYEGADAIKAGLAGRLVNYADAVAEMAEALKPKGVHMSANAAMAQGPQTENPESNITHEQDLTVKQPDANASVTAAADEMNRIMSILECDEAQGREPLAKALARMPGMTLEAAKAALESSPISAQAKTETGLDALMTKESPEAISGGEPESKNTETRMSVLGAAVDRVL
ncbi:S49 family peptidase [Scandinavium goeteborgense]|uniref:S49 family peptidase n=1 Tax=Scandinavium goeteborgense TaxID=1851514 RepID=UPI0021662B42|nr:S49 family peptidase [Scandinavium goeteborgense]MCS2152380.1 S49 family peptidase [Scandinavium goeteborgense]